MSTEVIRNVWESLRCTWETRGDNILLAYQMRLGLEPPLQSLEENIGSQIRSLPEVGLPAIQKGRLKFQIMHTIEKPSAA
jgi:hypothetical protein